MCHSNELAGELEPGPYRDPMIAPAGYVRRNLLVLYWQVR